MPHLVQVRNAAFASECRTLWTRAARERARAGRGSHGGGAVAGDRDRRDPRRRLTRHDGAACRHGPGYWGRSSVMTSHGAFESTKVWNCGAMPGSSSNAPSRIDTCRPPTGQIATEQARATDDAEGLHGPLAATVDAEQLLSGEESELLAPYPRLRAHRGPRVLAASRAVAVIRPDERRRHLEAHTAAETASSHDIRHEAPCHARRELQRGAPSRCASGAGPVAGLLDPVCMPGVRRWTCGTAAKDRDHGRSDYGPRFPSFWAATFAMICVWSATSLMVAAPGTRPGDPARAPGRRGARAPPDRRSLLHGRASLTAAGRPAALTGGVESRDTTAMTDVGGPARWHGWPRVPPPPGRRAAARGSSCRTRSGRRCRACRRSRTRVSSASSTMPRDPMNATTMSHGLPLRHARGCALPLHPGCARFSRDPARSPPRSRRGLAGRVRAVRDTIIAEHLERGEPAHATGRHRAARRRLGGTLRPSRLRRQSRPGRRRGGMAGRAGREARRAWTSPPRIWPCHAGRPGSTGRCTTCSSATACSSRSTSATSVRLPAIASRPCSSRSLSWAATAARRG